MRLFLRKMFFHQKNEILSEDSEVPLEHGEVKVREKFFLRTMSFLLRAMHGAAPLQNTL